MRGIRSSLSLAVLVAVAALPSISGASATAQAEPPPNPLVADMSPEEEAQVNSPAYAVAHQIIDLARFRDYAGERGYAYTDYDVPSNRVDLWWKGRLDDDVSTVIASAVRSGVTVNVHPVTRTLRFTQTAMRRLIANAELKQARLELLGLRPEHDMSGIHVSILEDPDDKTPAGRAARATKAQDVGKRVTGLPVLTVTEEKQRTRPLVSHRSAAFTPSTSCPGTAPYCRQNDRSSWSGGAAVGTSTQPICTTGFSVRMNSGMDIDRMLTAAHCETNPVFPAISSWKNGQGATFSSEKGTSYWNEDGLVINPSGPVQGYIFGGSITSDYKGPIRGPHSNAVTDLVRISGANTGQHNGLEVRYINQDYTCGYAAPYNNEWCYDMVVASTDNAEAAPNLPANVVAATGDSGGPIYSLVGGTDSNGLYARGILHSSRSGYDASCSTTTLAFPQNPLFPDLCFTGLYYMDILIMDYLWGNAWDLAKVSAP